MASEILFSMRDEMNRARSAASDFMEYIYNDVDMYSFLANLSGMVIVARHLVLKAFGLPFLALATDAVPVALSNDPNGPRIRERATEFVSRDSNAKSDYGHAMRKCLRDVFGLKFGEGATVLLSSLGGWGNWPQVPMFARDVHLTAPSLLPIFTGFEACSMWCGYCSDENAYLSDGLFAVSRNSVSLDEEPAVFDELGAPPELVGSRLVSALASPVTLPIFGANGIQYQELGLSFGSASSKSRPVLGMGTILYPTLYVGLRNQDGMTQPIVADRAFYACKSLLLDVDLANATSLHFRVENLDPANPLMIGDRAKLYAATIRMSMNLAQRFTLLREPLFKRAKIAKI